MDNPLGDHAYDVHSCLVLMSRLSSQSVMRCGLMVIQGVLPLYAQEGHADDFCDLFS